MIGGIERFPLGSKGRHVLKKRGNRGGEAAVARELLHLGRGEGPGD